MEWNVADLMEAVADTVPEKEALVVGGGPRLTWCDFDERASRLANYLVAAGLEPGDHVALYAANGNEYLEGMYACFKARMVPINVNWRYRVDEIVYLFDDADVRACIVDPEFRPTLDQARQNLPLLSLVVETGGEYEAALDAASADRVFVGRRSPDDRYFLYTGGTTGYPKGVEWRQEDIIGAVWRATANLDMERAPDQVIEKCRESKSRYFGMPPFMHGASHWVAFGTWLGGGTTFCLRGMRFDPTSSLTLIEEEQVNMICVVGDAFVAPMLREIEGARARGREYDLSSLRVVISSGAPLATAYKVRLNEELPGVIIADTLGSSEAGMQALSPWRPGQHQTRFTMNADAAVLDEETLQPVEPGSGLVGVLAKSGYLPVGYYKDAQKTAKTFPVVNGRRYVVTGDHAIVEEDGTIVLLGRGSNCINTGGEKVYPEEVENVLKEHPAVCDCLVVGVPDERFGSAVTAVVSLESGGELTPEEAREFVGQKLARYKAPRHLVIRDQIGRAPSGKPDYKWALAEALDDLGLASG